MSSRFMYLYPFKHTSRVASVTHFNLNNPNHYHCTHATEFCHTAIIPWRGKRKKSHNWVPGLFRLLLPLPGPDPHKYSRTSPAWTDISVLFSRQSRHTDLVETGVYTVMLGNCFLWLCSLWSSLKPSIPYNLIFNCKLHNGLFVQSSYTEKSLCQNKYC